MEVITFNTLYAVSREAEYSRAHFVEASYTKHSRPCRSGHAVI